MCNVDNLMYCGVCCSLLSFWAVLQLIIMGVFYKIEATPLIDDVYAKEYADYDEFIKKTKKNFQTTAMNCWVAAIIYLVFGLLSILCIVSARSRLKQKSLVLDDDELFCAPPDEQKDKKGKK